MLIVQKFGGSSLANAERIRAAADIIARTLSAGHTPVAVLSAGGGSTDMMISGAKELSSSPPKREMDVLLSTGELKSVALMSMQLESMGIPAISLSGRQAGIRTDSVFGDARIEDIDTRRIRREIACGRVVAVAGFQGISGGDDITTLGRGGSDTSAAALAAALNADRCEIYSDVDGIYTADPRLVPNAKKLYRIDYLSMLRLSRSGSQVLHEKAVEIAMLRRVPMLMLSSFCESEGTLMSADTPAPPFCGITRDKTQNKITLVGSEVGFDSLAEMLSVLADADISSVPANFEPGEAAALNAGYSVENAIRETEKELRPMYPQSCRIRDEFERMVHRLDMNMTAEQVLKDFARHVAQEDVQHFADVFVTAKRTGGDSIAILKSSIRTISDKIEVERQIQTMLASKKLEFQIMCVVPLGMMLYMRFSFFEFLSVLYGNTLGVLVMTVCLAVYIAAYRIGKKIIQIEV